ncbi:hypothetical protein [Flavobacterium microcysteis]|uniref:Uncharacterized protein n=1 Tax=Flavobacterium microcysteis TaxID=2596891 RepID=A0A501QE53_9FLAO|nr:hypothetical protein [Flavobacterium microcysteis]TPD70441.1 hypothetical protein FJA49_05735 [Flavobacterium microcysteis]
MKKIFIAVAFFAGIGFASAQIDKDDNPQADIQDKIQQEPPRSTEIQQERAAKIDAERKKNEENLKAEKEAKDKGQSKNYTIVNPDKTAPVTKDSSKGVKIKKNKNK